MVAKGSDRTIGQILIIIMSLHCDLEDSKTMFLHDTLTHEDVSPYQVWLQKVKSFRRYHPDLSRLTFNDVLNPHRDLQHSKTIFHKTLMMMYYQTKFCHKGSAVLKI